MPLPSDIQRAAGALADTFLAGEFAARPMIRRAAKHFPKPWRGLDALTRELVAAFGSSTRPARRDLIAAITTHAPLRTRTWLGNGGAAKFLLDIGTRPKMRGAKGSPSHWDLPQITTPIGLARWLALTEPELQWFARPWRSSGERLQHYRHHWLAKRRGGHRLIEKPKHALKLIQRRILHRILSQIPPHDAVRSFRPQRNVISWLSQLNPPRGAKLEALFDRIHW